ncbi:methyltransferase-like protein 14-like [Achlya hypogyna]|uniref:Methyltransferase-like protein 14-like n=1 Tax=Achlya hypogyna TaxID=1202772 RepID=A0A1V9Z3X9_ACHHY|nr:methyltransferase-like protein 14-like [Achlya hypogyna]
MNDYTEHYLSTGELPQTHILSPGAHVPPQRKALLERKAAQISAQATAPCHVYYDKASPLRELTALGMAFDVVVVDPPWQEVATAEDAVWSAVELGQLNIGGIGAFPLFTNALTFADVSCITSVIFLWCGSGGTYDGANSHFDEATALLETWFRELLPPWVKLMSMPSPSAHGLVRRTKEQCLVGLRDHMWRDTSGHFVHSNIDTDVLVAPALANRAKPEAFYELVERFCLGRRRLLLLGTSSRPGWVTAGPGAPAAIRLDAAEYEEQLRETATDPAFPFVLGFDRGKRCAYALALNAKVDIDFLRPKPPQRTPKGHKKKPKS